MFPVAAGMEKGKSTKDRIATDIPLYFGKQKTPAVDRKMGEFTANRKTNATNKTDKEACEISFVSAVDFAAAARAPAKAATRWLTYTASTRMRCARAIPSTSAAPAPSLRASALRVTVVKLKEVKSKG